MQYANLFLKQQDVSCDLSCYLSKWQLAYFEVLVLYTAVQSLLFSSFKYLKIVELLGLFPWYSLGDSHDQAPHTAPWTPAVLGVCIACSLRHDLLTFFPIFLKCHLPKIFG